MLGASSPLELPLDHIFISLVVVSREELFEFDEIKMKQIDNERYILSGSVDSWRALFLSNPDYDLDPFFNVLSPILKLEKKGELWTSR